MEERKQKYLYYGIKPGLNNAKVYRVQDKLATYPYVARISSSFTKDLDGNNSHSIRFFRNGRLTKIKQNGWVIEDNACLITDGKSAILHLYYENDKYGSWCIYEAGGTLNENETIGIALENALCRFYKTANFYTPLLSALYEAAKFKKKKKKELEELSSEDITELKCKVSYLNSWKEEIGKEEFEKGTDTEIVEFNSVFKEVSDFANTLETISAK